MTSRSAVLAVLMLLASSVAVAAPDPAIQTAGVEEPGIDAATGADEPMTPDAAESGFPIPDAPTAAPERAPAPVANDVDPVLAECRRTRKEIRARAMSTTDLQARGRILSLIPSCVTPAIAPASNVMVNEHDVEVVDDDGKPPVGKGRLLGQFVVGGAGLVGGAVGGAFLGAAATHSWAGLGLGGLVGGLLGVSTGVYLVGASGGRDGSFAATAGCALLGGVAGVLLGETVGGRNVAVGVSVGAATITLSAMLGFHLTRRWDPDVRKGKVAFAPVVAPSSEQTVLGVAGRF